jgi:hypothetical protein
MACVVVDDDDERRNEAYPDEMVNILQGYVR